MDSAVVILVVEDEVLIQEVIEDALREGGYTVRKACSADEAIGSLDARTDQKFSALITDVNLSSSKTGWDVAHHARKLYPSFP